jgi:hypothetical protein
MVIEWIAGVQPVVVGAVLVWASYFKLVASTAPAAARRSALSRLVGKERVVGAYRTVGAAELGVGVLLLLPTVFVASYLAVGLTAGLLGYLGYARWKAPDSSCGCLGEKLAPVRWRSVARAGVLMAASVLALFAAQWWPVSIVDSPLAPVVLVAELALVFVLSPELDHRWLIPLRRWRIRMAHPLGGQAFEVPLESTLEQLYKSEAYRGSVDRLRSEVLEHWDEGDWRILTYAAGAETAVFAVPRLTYWPSDVRVVFVPADADMMVG